MRRHEAFEDNAYEEEDAEFEANVDQEIEFVGLETNEDNGDDKNKDKDK